MIKKCVLAICISFLLISKASATKFHSFSAEIGATAESIDFTTYDSKFSGEENLSNLAVAAKIGWRNDSAPWPPFEGRLGVAALRIEKNSQFFYQCAPGVLGEFILGAGEFLNVGFGGVYCNQSFSTAIVMNTSEPTKNPYPSSLARIYGIAGVTFEGSRSALSFAMKTTNDRLQLTGTDGNGPSIIRFNNLEITYTIRQ